MKIIADKPVRQYEVTYILPVSLTGEQQQSAIKAVEALYKKYSFSVVSTEEWGKKEFSYSIIQRGTRHTEGLYIHQRIEGAASGINELSRAMALNDSLLRQLVVIASSEEHLNGDEVTKSGEEQE